MLTGSVHNIHSIENFLPVLMLLIKRYWKDGKSGTRIRDGRSLLFLTPTLLLLRRIQLRLQSDSENFSNIILRLRNF